MFSQRRFTKTTSTRTDSSMEDESMLVRRRPPRLLSSVDGVLRSRCLRGCGIEFQPSADRYLLERRRCRPKPYKMATVNLSVSKPDSWCQATFNQEIVKLRSHIPATLSTESAHSAVLFFHEGAYREVFPVLAQYGDFNATTKYRHHQRRAGVIRRRNAVSLATSALIDLPYLY